jgi:hypothetical protein
MRLHDALEYLMGARVGVRRREERSMEPGAHLFQIYRPIGSDLLWWRLIGSNGRALGCAISPERSLAEVRISIRTIVDSAEDLVVSLHPTPERRWAWTLSLGHKPVVRGAVSYDRHVRCGLAWRRFVAALPSADVGSGVFDFEVGNRVLRQDFQRERLS